MIVAITGGTGFIGQRVIQRHLAQHDTVRVITRRTTSAFPAVEQFVCDLTQDNDSALCSALSGCDVLYHCAGELRDPAKMRVLHVDGTRRLINAAKGRVGRWVQLSSVGVYGAHSNTLVTEATPFNPEGEYETTKAESDLMVTAASAEGAFEFTTLRPSNVFAPDMPNQSLFGLINAIARGRFFYIGKGDAQTTYVHADNVACALELLARHPDANGHAFNLSDDAPQQAVVEWIASELGMRPPSGHLPRPLAQGIAHAMRWMPSFPLTPSRVRALTNRTTYPVTKISSILGYQAPVNLESGIREMVRTWKNK